MLTLNVERAAEVAYEAFRAEFGGLDAVHGTRTVGWKDLPSRVRQGWARAAAAVLGEVHQEQALLTVEALDAGIKALDAAPDADPVIPVHPESVLGKEITLEGFPPMIPGPDTDLGKKYAESKKAEEPAGHRAAKSPRK